MEAVTAFVWGPACLAITYGILQQRPWRLPLMIVVSLGQIYGDVLYYGTCWLEGGGGAPERMRAD
jgi:cholestenol delta-isomerase